MKKIASFFLVFISFFSTKGFSNSFLEGMPVVEIHNNTDPKKNKKTTNHTNSDKDLAVAETNSMTIEELRFLLIEIAADEELSEANYLKEQLLNVASEYKGVRYRFGGMSRNGMDCSGFVKIAFDEFNIRLPRTSREMAATGEKINNSDAQKGDLIFFKTGKSSRINHVGIITDVLEDEIKFIHSSRSKGVIISSTKEAYYKRAFAQVNRVFDVSLL